MEDKKQPIIVKKVNKGGHGHHGGAWKVAMADFAIAMMAFFMVMWLLGGTSVEQKAAISSYFKNPSLTQGKSHVAAQGQIGPGGASTSMIKLGGSMELPMGDGLRPLEKSNDHNGRREYKRPTNNNQRHKSSSSSKLSPQQILLIQESKQFRQIASRIKVGFNKKALKKYKDQLYIDISDQGLRIQIVDRENRPMFASGSAFLRPYARKILKEIALVIKKIPTKISITGHTDSQPYVSRPDYSNWELSADRANAARRALVYYGVKPAKIARVVGLGSSILFDKDSPKSQINRRISIIILNNDAMKSLKKEKKSNNHWKTLRQFDPLAQPAYDPNKPGGNNNSNSNFSPRKIIHQRHRYDNDQPAVRLPPKESNDSGLQNIKLPPIITP